MELLLFTSAFCGACTRTRATVTEAVRLVPGATLTELDVVRAPDEAQAAGIRRTPTVVVRDDAGVEVFRAEGVPTLPQVLAAAAKALPHPAAPAARPASPTPDESTRPITPVATR